MRPEVEEIRARSAGGDLWETWLPAKANKVKGRPRVYPRHNVHAASEAEAIEEARRFFATKYVAYQMGLSMSLVDMVLYYIDRKEERGGYTVDTADDYRGLVRRYVEPYFDLDADVVTVDDVERLYAYLMAEGGKDGQGISINTVHKLNSVLRSAYQYFLREKVVAFNPMPSVELAARVKPHKRAFTNREMALILGGLEDAMADDSTEPDDVLTRNCLFGAYLDVWLGGRVGEVSALTRGDVMAIEGAFRLEHSMSERRGLHRKEPKTAAGKRTITADDEAMELVKRHYAWQASSLTDAQRDSDSTPVCCTVDGGFIAPSTMSAAFKDMCAKVGVKLAKGESFHLLRHTNLTMLLANRENPEEVRRRGGHARIGTTLDNYGHSIPSDSIETAQRYSERISRIREGGDLR